MYAKAVNSGKTTKCSDCYSEIIIPKAPKIRKKPEIDIENAETFSLGQNASEPKNTPDPFKKSAEALLAEASRQEEDESPPIYEDTPNVLEWIKNVFGIFKDPGVIMHWIVLSVAAAINRSTTFHRAGIAAIATDRRDDDRRRSTGCNHHQLRIRNFIVSRQ